MQFRKKAANNQKGQPDLDILEAYLRRFQLDQDLDLVFRARHERQALFQLEEDLRRRKKNLPLSPHITEIKQLLRMIFGPTSDLVYRELKHGKTGRPILAVGMNGMTDRNVSQSMLSDLLDKSQSTAAPSRPDQLVEWIAQQESTVPGTEVEEHLSRLIDGILNGDTILFVEGATRAIRLATPGWEHRTISEPSTEEVIRGPREGFVESFVTNASLLRRRLRDERLRVETLSLGDATSTRVGLVYLSSICKQTLVDEAKRRLERVNTVGFVDSGYLEEFIEDTPWTVFPLVKATERPDTVAGALLEGRLAILADGSPFALVVPTSFADMMQAPEDYYERYPIVTFLRLLRWVFAAVALLGPSLYVALTTFHPEMIPTPLMLSLMAAREGIPFPAVVEALMMEIAFEALREAGVRMPRAVGQAISIVGALVVGEAAVQAGIVSAPMVIVVALTGISSFIIPRFSGAIALRMLRFPMLILAGAFGAFGITLGVLAVALHLMSLRSFGAPYFAPFGPWLPADLQDALVRKPHWAMHKRPASTEALDRVRTPPGQAPGPRRRGRNSS